MIKILIFIILGITGTVLTMQNTIQLPPAHVIREHLYNAHLSHFVDQTKIDTSLGDREINPSSFVVEVETHVYGYIQLLRIQMRKRIIQARIEKIIKCILQDSPDICRSLIYNLKNIGILMPAR
jgi:hypothetical protein